MSLMPTARSYWLSASCIRKAQHQPHVLDRGARGALAQIIETRNQNRLMVFRAREDIELKPVGLVERLRLDASALDRRIVERHDRDVGAISITLRQRGVQFGR